jgi:hypothetical protein
MKTCSCLPGWSGSDCGQCQTHPDCCKLSLHYKVLVYTLSQSESTQFNFLWCLRMQPLWGATADSLESADAMMIILEITVMCVSTVL